MGYRQLFLEVSKTYSCPTCCRRKSSNVRTCTYRLPLLPRAGRLMKRWQILAAGLGYDAKLVVRYRLEQRFSKQAESLHLFRRRATFLSLVIVTHGIDSLLNQRLAGLDQANEGALIHYPTPITSSGHYRMPRTPVRLFGRGHKLLPTLPLVRQPVRAGRRAPWRRGWLPGLGR